MVDRLVVDKDLPRVKLNRQAKKVRCSLDPGPLIGGDFVRAVEQDLVVIKCLDADGLVRQAGHIG